VQPRETPPFQPSAWLELDRVRTVLSCIILAGLLALIVIGGRKTASMPQSEYLPRSGKLSESLLFLRPHAADEDSRSSR
jgi:hypothetical protein